MAGGSRGGRGGRGNKPGSHRKGAAIGSGGKNRRRLRGKGPTPPAQLRPGHPATRRAAAARPAPASRPRPAPPAAPPPPAQARRADDRGGSEVVVGRNPVAEALRARVPATALHVAPGQAGDQRVREAVDLAVRAGVPVLEASRSELDRLAGRTVHQGLVLVVPPYSYRHPDDLLDRARQTAQAPLLVALDGVTDPRNLGAVIRSVVAFGGQGVLVPERRAAGLTAAAWKASAGTAAYVPVARATNLVRALHGWRDAGLVVVGLAAQGALPLDALEAALDPLVLVVGSEGRGLSRLVGESCDLVVRIPMAGAESLNASVAAGVALYEVARRRRGG